MYVLREYASVLLYVQTFVAQVHTFLLQRTRRHALRYILCIRMHINRYRVMYIAKNLAPPSTTRPSPI